MSTILKESACMADSSAAEPLLWAIPGKEWYASQAGVLGCQGHVNDWGTF